MSHVCCEPCKALEKCCSSHSCCLQCHFTLEEELAAKYGVPLHHQAWLKSEHRRLKLHGYPKGPTRSHARREMVILRQYLPPHEIARLEEDHDFHERGDLAPR